MDNRELREQYHDMMREKNALKDRQAGIKRKAGVEDESEDDSSEGDSDLSESELKARAIQKIKDEISDDDSGSDDDGEESDNSGDGVVRQNFDQKNKEKAKKQKEVTGIMGMKFMKNAELAKKNQIKDQAKRAIEQIEDADES